MSFWSSLDWGSFAGGVIGAAGAFLAVIFADKRAENRHRPTLLSKQVKAVIDADFIIDDGMRALQKLDPHSSFDAVLETIITCVTRPIERALPSAVEFHNGLYRILLHTLLDVQDECKEWLIPQYLILTEYRNSPESSEEGTKLKERVLKVLSGRYIELLRMNSDMLDLGTSRALRNSMKKDKL